MDFSNCFFEVIIFHLKRIKLPTEMRSLVKQNQL
jgi:hypothetical protein